MSKRDTESEGPPLPASLPRKKRVVRATLIDHTYTDYSTYRITNTDDSNEGRCSTDNFPRKLHYILSRPEYHHIISWMPHGRAWKIWNRELLVSVVCKEQFKHEKFESFNRQVNGWGFKRLFSNGPDYKCYYNQFFLRGLPDLTSRMNRLDKPGKRLPNKLEEPDLYEISRRFPLSEANVSSGSEAPIGNEPSVMPNSYSLTVPHAYKSFCEQSLCEQSQTQTFRFDYNECSSSDEALHITSYASTVPELVSRGSSENKTTQWQPEPRKNFDCLHLKSYSSHPDEHDQRFYQNMDLSLARNNSFVHQESPFGNAPTNPIGCEDDYNRHWKFPGLDESTRPYNKPADAEEENNIIDQQQYMVPSHQKFVRPMKRENNPLYYSVCRDDASQKNETATEQEIYSCSTDYLYDHLGQQYTHWYPAQQQQQQQQHYYSPQHQGHSDMHYTNAFEPKGHNLNFHYAHQSLGSESPHHAHINGTNPYSARSQYHHSEQQQYEGRYIPQAQYVQDTQGFVDAYNIPFEHHVYQSNENYSRNSHCLDHWQHHPSGIETHHEWQAQYMCNHPEQSGTQLHENRAIKSSYVDALFQSCSTDGKTPHD
eukprot:CCRYP_012521-RA/>CCRYP_012521-RA protein AED:0.01 eAED:0.01 QI:192/1/1/1/1/1/2/407/595